MDLRCAPKLQPRLRNRRSPTHYTIIQYTRLRASCVSLYQRFSRENRFGFATIPQNPAYGFIDAMCQTPLVRLLRDKCDARVVFEVPGKTDNGQIFSKNHNYPPKSFRGFHKKKDDISQTVFLRVSDNSKLVNAAVSPNLAFFPGILCNFCNALGSVRGVDLLVCSLLHFPSR